jgi:hypothetical protein
MPWHPRPTAAKPKTQQAAAKAHPHCWRGICHLMAGVRATSDGDDVYLDLNGERPLVVVDTDDRCGGLDLLDLIAYLKAHRPDLLEAEALHLDLPVT